MDHFTRMMLAIYQRAIATTCFKMSADERRKRYGTQDLCKIINDIEPDIVITAYEDYVREAVK